MSSDAATLLEYDVGLVDDLPVIVTPGAPVARAGSYRLAADASSDRPGARIVVTLDVGGVVGARSGELLLGFDPTLVRPVSATGSGTNRAPLIADSEGEGQYAVAFASARALTGRDASLAVAFEVATDTRRAVESAIRVRGLRLNGAKVDPGFEYAFQVRPYEFRLYANYPNPFNPETWIPFELAEDADATIRIYGMAGRLVRTLELGARAMGEYTSRADAAYWDGANSYGERVASGVYVYELTAGEDRSLRRMVVRK
ncbi:hypothetical protein CMK11_20600 [Candidatus Poribacteria bacterium]|nr:hypothetical protein [Candidatus Poribacteria bacterium]